MLLTLQEQIFLLFCAFKIFFYLAIIMLISHRTIFMCMFYWIKTKQDDDFLF